MTAYVIFIREEPIRDPEAMEAYSRKSRENTPDPKLKPLAIYGALEMLEGKAPDGVVILEFPTVEDAKAWYYSPGYQAAAVHRQKGAEYRGFIVEGM